MKIAFVTNTCWNVYNFREGLVKHFLNKKHDVIVLAPIDNYSKAIKSWGVKHIPTPLDQTGTNPINDFLYCFKLWRVFKKEKPDVALSYTIKSNIYSSLAGKISNVPTICNVSGLGTVFLVKDWIGRLAVHLYRFAFRHSTHVFFQNKDDEVLFLEHINLRNTKTGLLPGSGINLIKFRYSNVQVSEPLRLIMISRIIEEKGVREYVEASRILKEEKIEAQFTLVGDLDEGHSRSIPKLEVEKWIQDKLVDYQPHSDSIIDLIRDHEAVVLPSYREGTPRTLLEGAAVGRALFASDVPGCKDVVKDGFNGFLFQVKNAKSIAEKIKLYCALTKDEKKSMAENSRKVAEEQFDETLVINKYIDTIHQIVDK